MRRRSRSLPASRRVVLALTAALVCAPAARAQTEMVVVGANTIASRVDGAAGPVVAFLSGMGDGIGAWDAVAPEIARCARTLRYDRPGIGASAPPPDRPVAAAEAAALLDGLLAALVLPPPYVLVAHSLGGLYAQAFARTFPTLTAGVVLVDASSPLEPEGVFVSTAPPPPEPPQVGRTRARPRAWRR